MLGRCSNIASDTSTAAATAIRSGHRDGSAWRGGWHHALCAQAIAAPWDGLDVSGLARRVSERAANLADAVVQRVVQLHVGRLTPNGTPQLVVGYQFPGSQDELCEHRRRLRLQSRHGVPAAQFAGRGVELESIDETNQWHSG